MAAKLIARRFETGTGGGTNAAAVLLPDALASEHVRRLAICAMVGAGLWTYAFLMDTFVRPATLGVTVPSRVTAVQCAAIAVSLIMLAYVRYSSHVHERKIDAGLVYVVLNAAAVALLNTWLGLATERGSHGLSWNAVVILVAAMILPTRPRKMLAASLAAAAMDPIAVWVTQLRGAPGPAIANAFVFYMPNFACAVVAMLPSHVLHGIGRRLQRAHELGSYQLTELLGRGGMGEVWRAQHRLLARGAAVKLVRPELLGAGNALEAEEMLRRFEHEAQATAALTSPHTIQIFDFGTTDEGAFYYVMELLAGQDLQSLVRDFGPVSEGRALYLIDQACESLAEAHARGLVHRDVTPSNIYICRAGLDYDFVKVLDFGLVSQSRVRPGTASKTTSGTPAYMAPEIIMGTAVDQRADVYALGCVLYFLVTGQPVFEASQPSEMFLQHVQASPTPPSQRSELAVSRALDDVVLACLEKDPRRRPQDAAAVREMVRRIPMREPWDQDAARRWWERHFVDLTQPAAPAPLESNPHRSPEQNAHAEYFVTAASFQHTPLPGSVDGTANPASI